MVNRMWNAFKRSTTDGLSVIIDDRELMGPAVKSRYDPFKGSAREYVWTDDAACNSSDPDLFQVAQEGDPAALGLKSKALAKLNRERAEEAVKICESCPVKKRCLSEAEPSDLYWSVRGGLMPTRLDRRVKWVPSFDLDPWDEPYSCPRHGRENIKTRQGGRGGQYCVSCSNGVL